MRLCCLFVAKLGQLEKSIKVGAVSYLNTKPLLYGFQDRIGRYSIEMVLDYPSKIAELLTQNRIDIGLVPIAIWPQLNTPVRIGNYGIAADGAVVSVALFSNTPLTQIKKIHLDYQSKTSVALVKILCKEYWHIEPEFVQAEEGYESGLPSGEAAVIIGDRAFFAYTAYAFQYDLALEWKNYTGLPFVFAAWLAQQKFEEDFILAFNNMNEKGLKHLEDVVAQHHLHAYDLNTYYTKNIQYKLTDFHIQGMHLFLEKMQNL